MPDPIENLTEVTDPKALQALAHPRRLDLLDVLTLHGPLTASQCADLVHDSVPSCSYHLRQLARFGFVEPAPARDGRERPWQAVNRGLRFGGPDADAAQRAAAETLGTVLDDRRFTRIRELQAARPSLPAAWQDVSDASDFALRLTADELRELLGELHTILMRHQQRTFSGPHPDDARLVRVFQWVLPDA